MPGAKCCSNGSDCHHPSPQILHPHGQGRRNVEEQSAHSTCSGCAWIQSTLSASHLKKKKRKSHHKYSFSHPSLSPSPSELIHGSGSRTAAGLPSPPQLTEAQSNTIRMIAGPAVRNHCRTQNNSRPSKEGKKKIKINQQKAPHSSSSAWTSWSHCYHHP